MVRAVSRWLTPGVVDSLRTADVRLSRSGSTITDGGADALGDVDAAGVAYVYTLHNDGADALTVASVATGTLSNVTSATVSGISTPVVVAPGGSTTFTVTVTPTAAGACSYTLTVTSDDPDAEAVYTVSVSGTGTGFEASYSTWTEWTYTMFGGGAPDYEGTPAEYTSMSYVEGTGWNPTATYAAERDVPGEGTAWLRAPTVVWSDAPTDYSLGLDMHVQAHGVSLINRMMGVMVGAAVNDADTIWSGWFRLDATRSRPAHGAGTGNNLNGGTESAPDPYDHARILHFPLPGSGRQHPGLLFCSPRYASGVPHTNSGYPTFGRGADAAPAESVHKIGVWWGSNTGASDGASGPTRIRGRGFVMPRAPWDGGTVGTAPGEWQLLTYDGGTPTADTSAVYVSNGGAGDAWDVTIDGTKGQNTGLGWDPSGNKRPRWDVTPPAGIVLDGSQPVLVAIEPQAGWATADQVAIGVGLRPSGGSLLGNVVLLEQFGATARRPSVLVATASGVGGNSTNVVGGLVPCVGPAGGTKYLGVGWAVGYLGDGPDDVSVAAKETDWKVSFTGDAQLFVIVTNGVAGSASRRVHAKIWVCNLNFDLMDGP